MTQGRLAALVGPEDVALQSFDVPDPGPGALVARVRRANVCGSEVHVFHFKHPVIQRCVLGHEFVGEIIALGDGVERDYAGAPVQVGDRVVAAYFRTCRRCPACLTGDFNLCQNAYAHWIKPPETAPHFHGAFATHYYLNPDQYFFRVPDALSDEVVAGANCGLSQVLFGLDRAGLTAGQSLVIQGAGGLGLNAAAVAHEAGARVIVVEGIEGRIELARRFGADEIVDMREHTTVQARLARVQELVGGAGADVVLEVSGVPAAFLEGIGLARPGGTLVEIGNVSVGPEHEVGLSPGLVTRKALRVIGCVRYQPWFLERALRFLERRHAEHPFDALSDREYGLEQVGEAIRRAESKQVARPAIVPV